MTEREYMIRDLVDQGNVTRKEAEIIVDSWIKNIMAGK